MKIEVQFGKSKTQTQPVRMRSDAGKATAKSDHNDPRHECDNIYVGGGLCVCWRCGNETRLVES